MIDKDTAADQSLDPVDRALRLALTVDPITDPLEVLSDAELVAPITANPHATAPVPAMPPIVVTGYRIIQEINSGGQATVFRAVQQSTGRVVALKILPGGLLAGARAANASIARRIFWRSWIIPTSSGLSTAARPVNHRWSW